MKAVVMRVKKATVKVERKCVSSISQGILVLLGVHREDTEDEAVYLARKIANARLFSHGGKEFEISVAEERGEALVVSQFTLYGNTVKGRRPSFDTAAPRERAERLYRRFIEELKKYPLTVKEGIFGAYMLVSIENDGPVTLIFDTSGK